VQKTHKVVMMKPVDSVAVALTDIPAGTRVRVVCGESVFEVEVEEPIEFGHKFAVRPIAAGESILKYGEVIGRATADIRPGQHVHIHNLEGVRGRGDQLAKQQ
jgi:altronate dehydratase small subunit